MALPLVARPLTLEIYDELISRPYVEITIQLLKLFGVTITEDVGQYSLASGQLKGVEYTVEPDASSASYFLALGALAGEVTINNLSNNSLQGDRNFAKRLLKMGAQVEYGENYIKVTKSNLLKAVNIDMQDMPDVAMTLAVVALAATGTTTISGIKSWQVKETDRLHAMETELSKLGATVITTDDSIIITPPKVLTPNIAIDTYNDHRMAMCFSLIAALNTPVTINNYACVGKTFANYFELFNKLCYS
jgi:3-phosphoshikimate 1-carboxyvinyltransferase